MTGLRKGIILQAVSIPWVRVFIVGGFLLLQTIPGGSQEIAPLPGEGQITRDATQEQRIKSLYEESARDVYQSSRPYLSRWIGFGVFVVLCLILIAFLDRTLKQREQLRRMGFFDPPSKE